MNYVILDGILSDCDRVTSANGNGNDEWYSGKAKHFAGNLQFLAAPTTPRCGSPTSSPNRIMI